MIINQDELLFYVSFMTINLSHISTLKYDAGRHQYRARPADGLRAGHGRGRCGDRDGRLAAGLRAAVRVVYAEAF